jgi:Zn-dependent metalloprotease
MKMFTAVLFTLFMLVLGISCDYDSAEANFQGKSAVIPIENMTFDQPVTIDEIRGNSDGIVEINTSPETGLPREITGKFSDRSILSAEDALASLGGVRDIMGIRTFAYASEGVEERSKIRLFSLRQIYEGLPVIEGRFTVIATTAGEAYAVRGHYVNIEGVGVSPQLREADAKAMLGIAGSDKPGKGRLVIYSDIDTPAALCWEFRVNANSPASKRYIYQDANTGEILADIPVAVY